MLLGYVYACVWRKPQQATSKSEQPETTKDRSLGGQEVLANGTSYLPEIHEDTTAE